MEDVQDTLSERKKNFHDKNLILFLKKKKKHSPDSFIWRLSHRLGDPSAKKMGKGRVSVASVQGDWHRPAKCLNARFDQM